MGQFVIHAAIETNTLSPRVVVKVKSDNAYKLINKVFSKYYYTYRKG